MSTTTPKRWLFVCVENANRSQMAEAFARRLGGSAVEAYSAGSQPSGRVNARAIAAMAEVGCDLTRHRSSALADLPDVEFDVVVTMGCGDACPGVRARRREDWDIPDPRDMDAAEFRDVRDLLSSKIIDLLAREAVPGVPESVRIPYTVVHAFTRSLFGGNPAGVCLLDEWLPDGLMQRVAAENKLSETAFAHGKDGRYDLRWFTPEIEVDLCGHATLATAWVLLSGRERHRERVDFDTRSGALSVARDGDELVMNFPSRVPVPCETPPGLSAGLGGTLLDVQRAKDYLLTVFESESDVRDLRPDFKALAVVDATGIMATAPGTDVDFVSRFFAPRAGVPEDPVTGSAHCALFPYWGQRLGRTALRARQISDRGGELRGTWSPERCTIVGAAVVYSEGSLLIPAAVTPKIGAVT